MHAVFSKNPPHPNILRPSRGHWNGYRRALRAATHPQRQRPGVHFACVSGLAIERQIELAQIRPGKPVENAYVESFNGRLREECLNASWFRNLFDARRQIGAWRDHYNRERPHSALDYRTPEQFALAHASAGFCGNEAGQGGSIAAPSPHTPLPANCGAQHDQACRMI